ATTRRCTGVGPRASGAPPPCCASAPRPPPPRSCTSTAARSLTWRAAWPGLSWPPAIRCSEPCSRPHEPALRGAPPRLHPRRHALAGAGGRPPPRRDAAPLGSGVRHYRPGGGHVLRSPREAEPRWALVGPGRAARPGLPPRLVPARRGRGDRDPHPFEAGLTP